jgi:hypothetical protein
MAATSNRYEALSKEEELDLDDEDLSTDRLSSDESADAFMVDQEEGRSNRKKTVSFKTVKKRGKTKNKLKLKASLQAAASLEAKAVSSGTSSLYRSSLASTFASQSPALVSLGKPCTIPSGRRGGLPGSPQVGKDLSVGTSSVSDAPGCKDSKMSSTQDSLAQFHDASENNNMTHFSPDQSSSINVTPTAISDLTTEASTTPPASQLNAYTAASQPCSTPGSPSNVNTTTETPPSTETSTMTTSQPLNPQITEITPSVPDSLTTTTVSQSTVTTTKPKGALRLHTF